MPIVDKVVVPDYDNCVDDLPQISVGQWLYNCLTNNLEKYGDSTWMTDASTGQTISLSEFISSMKKIASALWKKGLRPGEVVLIMGSNSIELTLSFLAVLQCGGVVNALTLNLLPTDIQFRCKQTKPKFAIIDDIRAPRVLAGLKDQDGVKEVFVIGAEEPDTTSFKQLLQDNGDEFPENVEVDLNSSPIIVYSSGTTGMAKAILLDHFSWRKSDLCFKKGDALAHKKCLFLNLIVNIGGFQYVLLAAVNNFQMIVVPELKADNKLLEAIDRYKPDVIAAYPSVVVWMCKYQELEKYDLSSVQVLMCAGSCLDPNHEREIFKKLTNLKFLFMGYGMSETGVLTSSAPLGNLDVTGKSYNRVFGSCGRLLPNCRLKILDENGEKLGPMQEGHVVFQAPGFMRGYLDNPEAIKDIIRDGWCYSGDRGYYDENGNLYVTGRFKELIKFHLAHVVPANIEKHLLTHPAVAEAVVIGLPDEIAGEVPLACVVKRPGFDVTEQDLVDMVAGVVSDEEHLRGGVVFVDHIPRNDWGKPLRRYLLEAVLKK